MEESRPAAPSSPDCSSFREWAGALLQADKLLNSIEKAQPLPFLQITEQPKPKDHRFRYPCEGPTAGALLGVKSTTMKKTFPEVQICYLPCKAKIIGSLVFKDDNKPHPYKLVGENCMNGIVVRMVHPKSPKVCFRSLGIQCVTRKDLKASLKTRKKLNVDPFNNIDEVLKGDLRDLECKVVRICFQAFLEDRDNPGSFTAALEPVVTDKIFNKKDTSLKITKMNKNYGLATGNEELFIFCEKVDKDDIQVEFYEETQAGVIWRGYGVFGENDLHHQVAIVVRTPSYRDPNIDSNIKVKISLKRPSDEHMSEPMNFTYVSESTINNMQGHCNKIGDSSVPETKDIKRRSEDVRKKLKNKIMSKALKEEAPAPLVQLPQGPLELLSAAATGHPYIEPVPSPSRSLPLPLPPPQQQLPPPPPPPSKQDKKDDNVSVVIPRCQPETPYQGGDTNDEMPPSTTSDKKHDDDGGVVIPACRPANSRQGSDSDHQSPPSLSSALQSREGNGDERTQAPGGYERTQSLGRDERTQSPGITKKLKKVKRKQEKYKIKRYWWRRMMMQGPKESGINGRSSPVCSEGESPATLSPAVSPDSSTSGDIIAVDKMEPGNSSAVQQDLEKDASKRKVDGDVFVCGKCRGEFRQFEEFVAHKMSKVCWSWGNSVAIGSTPSAERKAASIKKGGDLVTVKVELRDEEDCHVDWPNVNNETERIDTLVPVEMQPHGEITNEQIGDLTDKLIRAGGDAVAVKTEPDNDSTNELTIDLRTGEAVAVETEPDDDSTNELAIDLSRGGAVAVETEPDDDSTNELAIDLSRGKAVAVETEPDDDSSNELAIDLSRGGAVGAETSRDITDEQTEGQVGSTSLTEGLKTAGQSTDDVVLSARGRHQCNKSHPTPDVNESDDTVTGSMLHKSRRTLGAFTKDTHRPHINLDIISRTNHQCTICGKPSPSCSSLPRSSGRHPKGGIHCRYYSCEKFSGETGKSHERTHTGEGEFLCKYCDIPSISDLQYKRPMRKHTGRKPYQCKYCDGQFRTDSGLKSHASTHTGVTPHRCRHCGKSYKSVGHLESHQSSHEGFERRHQCECCGKTFRKKSSLQRHERIHTGEGPYQSGHYDKAFNKQVGTMRGHKRLHTK